MWIQYVGKCALLLQLIELPIFPSLETKIIMPDGQKAQEWSYDDSVFIFTYGTLNMGQNGNFRVHVEYFLHLKCYVTLCVSKSIVI